MVTPMCDREASERKKGVDSAPVAHATQPGGHPSHLGTETGGEATGLNTAFGQVFPTGSVGRWLEEHALLWGAGLTCPKCLQHECSTCCSPGVTAAEPSQNLSGGCEHWKES